MRWHFQWRGEGRVSSAAYRGESGLCTLFAHETSWLFVLKSRPDRWTASLKCASTPSNPGQLMVTTFHWFTACFSRIARPLTFSQLRLHQLSTLGLGQSSFLTTSFPQFYTAVCKLSRVSRVLFPVANAKHLPLVWYVVCWSKGRLRVS